MPRWERAQAGLWRYGLQAPVGGSGVAAVDLVVVALEAEGETGLGFSYVLGGGGEAALATARSLLASHVATARRIHPAALWRRLAAALNRQGPGPAFVGLAAIDVAAWDLHAKLAGVPLYAAMGGEAREVAVYGSGFRAGQPPAASIAAAERYAAAGFSAVKLRAAGDRSDTALLAALARAAPGLELMVDANEKCDLVRASALAAACRDHGVLFLEEPLPSWNVDGYTALAQQGLPLAGGEHLQGAGAFKPYLDRGALAIVQPDLAMTGGLTEALRIAALAEHYGRTVSPHFLPDLFVHLAAAAPNVAWLEHFPLLEPLFAETQGLVPRMTPPERPGHGLLWAEDIRRKVEVVADLGA